MCCDGFLHPMIHSIVQSMQSMKQMAWEDCQKNLLGLLWFYLKARERMSKCAVIFGLNTAFRKFRLLKECLLNHSKIYKNKYLSEDNGTIKITLNSD